MTVMKNLYKIFAAALICILAAPSCNFLEVVPPETMEIEDTMKDKDRAEAFLYSCYEGTTSLYKQRLLRSFVSSTDEYGLPTAWGVNSQRNAWGLVNASEVWTPAWDVCYTYIGKTNLFLKLLDQYTPAHSTAEDIARWKAECTFLLAFYHYYLLESYGPVPIMDHFYPNTTPKTDFPGRSHYDYCVDRIVAWLDEAAENGLPDYIAIDSELGRATATAAKALKARILLYAASPLWNGEAPANIKSWKNKNYETPGYGFELVSSSYDETKWDRALTACKEAIEFAEIEGKRQLFSLEDAETRRIAEDVTLPDIAGASDELKQYASLMSYLMVTAETDGNKEFIWGSSLPASGAQAIYLDWENTALPHAVTYYNGSTTGGRSGVSPFLYSIEHFYTESGKLPAKDSDFYPESEWFESAGLSRNEIIKLNDKREPRFYAWFAFDGAEVGSKLSAGQPLIANMRNKDKQGYNPSKDNDLNITGFLCKKWIQPNLTWNSSTNTTNTRTVPFPIIRLAELYLNLAECYAATGQTQLALDNLNVIRKRAGIPALTTADITSDMPLMEWVRNERFVELWGEGHRYFDLRRWCTAPQFLKAGVREGLNFEHENPTFEELNQRTTVNQKFVWNDRMYFQPIVTAEMYSNPQLVQAPGY